MAIEAMIAKSLSNYEVSFAKCVGFVAKKTALLLGTVFLPASGLIRILLKCGAGLVCAARNGGFMKTDILRTYLFPENIPGLVPENVVWSEITRAYRTRFINEVLKIYCQDVGGMIARKDRRFDAARDAAGAAYHKNSILSNEISCFRLQPVVFALEAARLTRFYLHASLSGQHSLLRF